ncbi:uncharacterized protein Gasu_64080, partial [Galdieria sulphuraria]
PLPLILPHGIFKSQLPIHISSCPISNLAPILPLTHFPPCTFSNSQLTPIPLPLSIGPFFPHSLQDNFQTKVALSSFTRNRPLRSPIKLNKP